MPRAVPLRQWVLTMPFAWRKRLAYDGALWSALTRVFTKRVSRLYGKHGGAVIALQRTSSDMKLNPHVHAVFLDGHYVVQKDELDFETRSRLSTTDVASSSVGSRRRRLHQSSIPCATRESSRRRASCRRASLPSLPSRCRSIPRRTTSPLVVAPTDRGPSSCAGPSAWTCCNVPSERAKGTFTGEGSVQGARKSQLRGAKLACVCSPWSLSPRASPATSARSVSPPALPSPSPREVLPIGKVGSSREPPSATRLLRRATGRARGPVFLSTDNGAKVVSKCRRPNTPSSVHIHPNALKPPPSVQSSPGETALIFLRSYAALASIGGGSACYTSLSGLPAGVTNPTAVVVHELTEVLTDPRPFYAVAWQRTSGETGDSCQNQVPAVISRLAPTGGVSQIDFAIAPQISDKAGSGGACVNARATQANIFGIGTYPYHLYHQQVPADDSPSTSAWYDLGTLNTTGAPCLAHRRAFRGHPVEQTCSSWTMPTTYVTPTSIRIQTCAPVPTVPATPTATGALRAAGRSWQIQRSPRGGQAVWTSS